MTCGQNGKTNDYDDWRTWVCQRDNGGGKAGVKPSVVAPGSDLHVSVLVQTSSGVSWYPLADLADGSMPSWAPTNPITGDTTSIPDGSSLMVALHFHVPTGGGSWQIDDVYVDPYRAG